MKPGGEQDGIEFIHDPDFEEWVLRPSKETDQYWEAYIAKNPPQKNKFEQAGSLIKGLVHHQKSLREADVSMLWDKDDILWQLSVLA